MAVDAPGASVQAASDASAGGAVVASIVGIVNVAAFVGPAAAWVSWISSVAEPLKSRVPTPTRIVPSPAMLPTGPPYTSSIGAPEIVAISGIALVSTAGKHDAARFGLE